MTLCAVCGAALPDKRKRYCTAHSLARAREHHNARRRRQRAAVVVPTIEDAERFRREQGWSVEEMAIRCGVTVEHYRRVTRGVRPVSRRVALVLARWGWSRMPLEPLP